MDDGHPKRRRMWLPKGYSLDVTTHRSVAILRRRDGSEAGCFAARTVRSGRVEARAWGDRWITA